MVQGKSRKPRPEDREAEAGIPVTPIDALEFYCAHHAEPLETILKWPWRRFEAFYRSFIRRHTVEGLDRRKDAIIAALWANSNWDDGKETRDQAIASIEENYKEAVRIVYGADAPQEEELDENNPFLAPALKAIRAIDVPDDAAEKLISHFIPDDLKGIDQ